MFIKYDFSFYKFHAAKLTTKLTFSKLFLLSALSGVFRVATKSRMPSGSISAGEMWMKQSNYTNSMYKIVQYIAVEGSTKRQKSPVTERSRSAEVPGLNILIGLYYIDK